MKKQICYLAAFFLLFTLPAFASTVQKLIVNGQAVENELAQFTFSGDDVVLHFKDGTTQTVAMDVVSLFLDVQVSTGICLLKSSVTDKLDINGLAPGTEIRIYDASGRTVLNATAEEARIFLPASNLKSGVYMMKAGKQTIKFVKR